jgi:multidrug resistance efflux pump
MLAAGLVAIAAFQIMRLFSATDDVDVETAVVTRGSFVETVMCRGELKAVRSRTVHAPIDAGDVQILKLARSGSFVRRGDIIVVFDSTKVRQSLVEKRAALGQTTAEVDRAQAEGRLATEATRTEQLERGYDVERAKLEVGTREVVSRYDAARADLMLGSAERYAREAGARLAAQTVSAEATTQGFINRRNEAAADLALAERQLAAMTVRAPEAGRLVVQTTWRGSANQSAFREGDRVWSGALIAEIPDPSALYATAKVDEVDRGSLKSGMRATVRSDAVPGLEMAARLTSISTLSRPDFSSWPFQRVFDVEFALDGHDTRLAVGLSSSIRVEVERLDQTLLIPARALIENEQKPVVYVRHRTGFEERHVIVARRGDEQVALASGVEPGERVALRKPTGAASLLAGTAAGPR